MSSNPVEKLRLSWKKKLIFISDSTPVFLATNKRIIIFSLYNHKCFLNKVLKEFTPIHGSINIDMDMSMILAVKLKATLQISLSLLSTQRYFRVLSQVIHRKLKMLNFKGNDWLNLYKGFLKKSQLKE